MGRVCSGALAFLAVSLVGLGGHANLSGPAKRGLDVTQALFVTHPGVQPIPFVMVRVTLRAPAACAGELVVMLGAQPVDVTRTPEGFSGNVRPKPRRLEDDPLGLNTPFVDEGAPLRMRCGDGPLRDTGIAFHLDRLAYEGW